MRLWKKQLWRYSCGASVIGVAMTPDASRIVAGSINKFVYFLDRQGNLLWKEELDHSIWNVSISNDGGLIGACTASRKPWEGSIYLFTSEGQRIWKHNVGGPLWSIAVNSRKFAIAGCWDNRVYCFREANQKWRQWRKLTLPMATKGVFGAAMNKDGSLIVAGSHDGFVYVIKPGTRRVEKFPSGAGIYGVSASSDGNIIAAGLENGCIFYFDRKKKQQSTMKVAQAGICGVCLTPSGSLVAVGSFDHRIYMCSPNEVLWEHRTDGRVWGVSLNHSGEYLVAGGGDGGIYLIHNLCTESAVDSLEKELKGLIQRQKMNGQPFIDETIAAKFYLGNNLLHKALKMAESAYKAHPADKMTAALIEETYKRKVTLSPDDYETHLKLGILYKQQRKLDSAIKEFNTAASNPELAEKALSLLQGCLTSAVSQKASLMYDDISYIKYEHPSLPDKVKKNIEMFHTLSKIGSISGVDKILDIGCGPGRYPFAFAFRGKDAIGIDVSSSAIRRCNMTKNLGETGRGGNLKVKFYCMDGRKTNFGDNFFDLVTCMMGTIAHFSLDEKRNLILEIRRILKNGGHLLISTWNQRCATTAFLEFYRKRDRETLRRNLMDVDELRNFLLECGFLTLDVIPFALLPDEFYYELDLDDCGREEFRRIMMIESLVAKSFPNMEGQMYLLHAQKKFGG